MQNNQPQSKEIKKIIIEDAEYACSISKLGNKDSISLILKEVKPNKKLNLYMKL